MTNSTKTRPPDPTLVKAPAKGQEKGGIQSLERASAILDLVAAHPEGIGLADISARLALHNSTVFSLIKTLVSLGHLTQLPDSKHYRIGSHLFALAAGALNETILLSLATPILERLSEQTGEAAHLAIRSRHEIVVVARTAATGLLQLSGRMGVTRPAHATAIGKMLLAEIPPENLPAIIDALTLNRLTPSTITDRAVLLRELDGIRRDQMAHDRGELDPDVRCVAMPVRDFAGRCAGAMGFSGPVWRLSPERLEEDIRALAKAAAALSAKLGYRDNQAAG